MSFWGHSVHLLFFRKYHFQNAAFSFTAKHFTFVPFNSPYKSCLLEFYNLKCNEKLKTLKFNIVANRKMKKNANILEIANRRAERG